MAKQTTIKHDVRALILSGMLLGFSLVGVMLSHGNNVEERVFRLFYDFPVLPVSLWLFLTQFGGFIAVLAAILVTWVSGYRRCSGYLTGGSLLAYALGMLIKELVARPRPLFIFDDVVVHETGVFGHGFPSVHTAFAVVLACTLWSWIPKHSRWLLILWVAIVALSRLYLGVHAPLDIVGGVAVGASSVYLCRIIIRTLFEGRFEA